MRKIFYLFSVLCMASQTLYSQCTGSTPLFVVDLSSSPTATWTSTSVTRGGSCCSDNNCVAFLITLHPQATEIALTISSGAIPTGSLYYQIGCGGMQTVGSTACISGAGPHLVTFCKPGNNVNTYTITSNPVSASPDFTMTEGTSAGMYANGLNAGTINWTSIFPGAVGAYNSYLSCTTCATPTITAPFGAPPLVRYVVSGTATSGCLPAQRYDTVNVTILDIPLPVELLNFGGSYNALTRAVELEWTTATEHNNQYFIIERSVNAIDWDYMASINGAGNSNTLQTYQYSDMQPITKAYYRLSQVDVDGNQTYFNPVYIQYANTNAWTVQIYPNPASQYITLQSNQGISGELYVTDAAGKVCQSTLITSAQQQVDVSQLTGGIYILQMVTDAGVHHSTLIIP